jgi:hypothetical protein
VTMPSAQGVLGLQVAAAAAGVALQNATPNIISWTAPNDGQNHRVMIFGGKRVTLAETGGVIQVNATDPGGGAIARQLDAGGHVAGDYVYTAAQFVVQAGTTVTVQQSSALTAGTSVTWAEIWGS